MSASSGRHGRVVLTNDDGIAANGIRTLARALNDAGLDVVVVAPVQNRSGVSRWATYSTPVALEPAGELDGVPLYACHGSPVDCVRVALMSTLVPNASLVVSGINHGPNLGDDTLNSGTVGAAMEGALLGLPALAVSQQSAVGHFHVLDALDQKTPVYDATARVAAAIARALLEYPTPDRTVLNLNAPARISDDRVEVTRLGRRFYRRASLEAVERDGVTGFLTYGTRDQTPPYEDAPGTDFAAVSAGRVSITPLSYAWHDAKDASRLRSWAEDLLDATDPAAA
jgi:5'-nucleotidase